MTPAETARLRQVSYERQLARGFKRPGYAGLVAERFGDAGPYIAGTLEQLDSLEAEPHVQKQTGASSPNGVNESVLASRV